MNGGIMIFYNEHGKAIAFSDDNEHIYLFSGQPVAYIFEDAVYNFNGKQLGWLERGWVRDLNGCCVFFSENANGSGPIKLIKQITPIKPIKQILPIKSIRNIKKIKPINQSSWSTLSGTFFN